MYVLYIERDKYETVNFMVKDNYQVLTYKSNNDGFAIVIINQCYMLWHSVNMLKIWKAI